MKRIFQNLYLLLIWAVRSNQEVKIPASAEWNVEDLKSFFDDPHEILTVEWHGHVFFSSRIYLPYKPRKHGKFPPGRLVWSDPAGHAHIPAADTISRCHGR